MKALKKIQGIRENLKTAKEDGSTTKQRQRLRNQISATQSRIRKKEELMFFHRAIKEKDGKMEALIKSLAKTLTPQEILKIHC